MKSSALILFGLVLLVGGCPPSEDEERRAATLAFLDSDPSPSSIAVIQPGAATKLAEVEPQVTDGEQRDRLVRALVLDDTDASRAVLLDLLTREPTRIPVAFDTARRFSLVPQNLDLLYPRLNDETRGEVFLEACWPSFGGEPTEVLDVCKPLWAGESAALQSRWLRLATHLGPHDQVAPYEALREGLDESLTGELDVLVERIGGGTVIPAEPPEGRDAICLSGVIASRRARTDASPQKKRQVVHDGGTVDVVPLARGDSAGVGARILGSLSADCVAGWATTVGTGRTSLQITLSGNRAAPTVTVDESEPGAALAECLQASLTATHSEGEARWIPLSGSPSFQLSVRSASSGWDSDDRTPLTDGELNTLAAALRETGTAEWRARLAVPATEEPLLRDLGSSDLGFCLAYVGADWDDCARWMGRMAGEDEDVEELLRAGLRDPDPSVRALARVALGERLDEDALEEAAKVPPKTPPTGDDDSADAPTGEGAP